MKKIVDIYEYMAMLRQLVEEGKEVSLLITGSSMLPFLVHERDYIYFKKPNRELRRGDMVFYRRKNGQYVMHRICRVTETGYDIVGDAQTEIEHGVERGQIFGLITRVRRKDKLLTEGDFCWEFFRRVWLCLIPLRPAILRAYGCLKKI